ncbi:PAS domain S-box protein [Phenylobacterium sp.]|uniref:PAS domain S-box protein n=1 Tax=Phenylobacterium sp. TaxID=1871053 RepID=UPI0035AD98D7
MDTLSPTSTPASDDGAPLVTGAKVDACALTEGPVALGDCQVSTETLELLSHAVCIAEFAPSGVCLNSNSGFRRLIRTQATEGLRLADIQCVGEDHERAAQALWRNLLEGRPQDTETCMRAADGEEVWVRATYVPKSRGDGAIESIHLIAVDITDAKRMTLEHQGLLAAINRAQAVIEFDPQGYVLNANENFLGLAGYSLAEIKGQHHSIFMPDGANKSTEYRQFWRALGEGEVQNGEFRRLGKNGREFWIQASYNPILDMHGKPAKVVKFAYDITEDKLKTLEQEGALKAIDRAQAVVEFDLNGTILSANKNFLNLMGYKLDDVAGRHHRMFCEASYVQTEDYVRFWERLGRGEYYSGEFRRVGVDGRDVWIQATYNPIIGLDGRVHKIIKFATDITEEKVKTVEASSKLKAIDLAQAVIEFDLDGNVISANENFIRTMGYSLREIIGQHHSIFCQQDYILSREYRDFWLQLSKGQSKSGRFHRIGKFGRDVFIEATYNPIRDLKGQVIRVIKYAYDVTESVALERTIGDSAHQMGGVMQSLASSISDIRKMSDEARELSADSRTAAERGVEAITRTLGTIEQIQKSATGVSEIVSVIGEISNQTNLLAFNAAIEAARAGDHGIGFSVVAAEVRKLAERSASAARQISGLIDEAVTRATIGREQTEDARISLERIVGYSARSSDAIRDISDQSTNQQAVSSQVGELIANLKSKVQ